MSMDGGAMGREPDGGSSADRGGDEGLLYRRRERHRKRRKPQIVVPSWRWWHLLAAIGVAIIGLGITILLVRGNGAP